METNLERLAAQAAGFRVCRSTSCHRLAEPSSTEGLCGLHANSLEKTAVSANDDARAMAEEAGEHSTPTN